MLFVGPAENLSSPTISEIEQNYDCISFTKPWRRASQAAFFNFFEK